MIQLAHPLAKKRISGDRIRGNRISGKCLTWGIGLEWYANQKPKCLLCHGHEFWPPEG